MPSFTGRRTVRPATAATRRIRHTIRTAAAAATLGALISLSLPAFPVHAAATPRFVQTRAKEVTSGTTNALAFTNANTAGNLIVVYVIWSNANAVSLSDSRANTYTSAYQRGRAHDLGQQLELPGLLRHEHRGRQQHGHGPLCHLDQLVRRHLHPRVLGRRQGQPGRRDQVGHRHRQCHEQWRGDHHQCRRPAVCRGRVIERRNGGQ
jgi:hypothetical protein